MARSVHVLTIAHPSDLARATVLVRSLANLHPGWPATIVVLARHVPGHLDVPEGTRVVVPADLGVDDLERLASTLEPEPLAFAVLAPILERLLPAGEPVLALAPSLVVVGDLSEIETALEGAEVVLVPHLTRLAADSQELLLAPRGTLHPGVIAVRPGDDAAAVLAHWPGAALRPDAGGEGSTAGEKARTAWLDALPARAAGVAVHRRHGFLVEPGDITADLTRGDDGVLALDGDPVALLDFADLDAVSPHRLEPAEDAPGLGSMPELAELARRHAAALTALDALQAPDALDVLADGTALDPRLRRLAGEAIDAGAIAGSVFGADGTEAFYAWLNAPAGRGAAAGLTRYHEAIWEDRVDLRAAYPHLDGPDAPGFAGWLWAHAPAELPMPAPLLPPRPGHLDEDASEAVTDPLWGVNVAGFFTSELGLGEAARLLVAGLDAARVPALPVQGTLVPPCRQGAEFHFSGPAEAPFPINIVCMNGDSIPVFAREAGPEFFADRHTIALWWWELGEFPADWRAAYEFVDEVWVASDLIRDAITPTSPVPVVKVPLPVTLAPLAPYDRGALGLPDDFVFLFAFDYHSTSARKNPVGLIEAFKAAFPPGSGASLVLKTINGENLPHEHERVLMAAGDHPDIHFINRYVSAPEKDALLAACDCYVSLHRSEGFGLTPAEAMYFGRPVIATGYGGVLEFMTAENSYLVGHATTTVGPDAHPYPPDGVWAEPDLDEAARLMRHVFEHPEEARERGARAAVDIRRTNSPQAAGAAMAERLRGIHTLLVERGQRSLVIPKTAALNLDAARAHTAPGRRPPGGNALIRRVRRAAWKVLGRDLQDTDRHLVAALETADARLREVAAELERHQMAMRAETLGAFRRTHVAARDVNRRIDVLETQSAAFREEGAALEQHLAEHRALPYMAGDAAFGTWDEPGSGRVLGYREPNGSGAGYRAFTDAFRGSEEHVRALQEGYVALLRDHAPVLDLGCGRGELLDLLAAAGIAASGVDGDAEMTAACVAKGLDVRQGDAIEHLRGLPDGALGAIVAMQVVEHLPAAALDELLELSRAKLRDGGVLIAETVNPHALNALKAFWVDPTHHHPLFPETLLELCRIAGFQRAYMTHPNGSGDVEADRFSAPAYAVVAQR